MHLPILHSILVPWSAVSSNLFNETNSAGKRTAKFLHFYWVLRFLWVFLSWIGFVGVCCWVFFVVVWFVLMTYCSYLCCSLLCQGNYIQMDLPYSGPDSPWSCTLILVLLGLLDLICHFLLQNEWGSVGFHSGGLVCYLCILNTAYPWNWGGYVYFNQLP